MSKFDFGDKVRDIVNGYQGIVTARHEYLNGCVRYHVDPGKVEKDGKSPEGATIDEGQLELVKRGVVKIPARDVGGPMPEPKRQAVPRN
jgi:hypothetical protein